GGVWVGGGGGVGVEGAGGRVGGGVRRGLPLPSMGAGLPLRLALAPPLGAVKATCPPATGSPESLAVTLTSKASAKAVLTAAVWFVPAATAKGQAGPSNAPRSRRAVCSATPRRAGAVTGRRAAPGAGSPRRGATV